MIEFLGGCSKKHSSFFLLFDPFVLLPIYNQSRTYHTIMYKSYYDYCLRSHNDAPTPPVIYFAKEGGNGV